MLFMLATKRVNISGEDSNALMTSTKSNNLTIHGNAARVL
jgi:hypothetical protein